MPSYGSIKQAVLLDWNRALRNKELVLDPVIGVVICWIASGLVVFVYQDLLA
jgi:hypothetical protein